MYSEKIENLINLALADGELTEKEKQVLFKNAEAEGIDLDEFEMVLDAKVFERTKSKTEVPTVSPQSNKMGDVKKCPACGAIIQSFQTRCADCGHEFRNVDSNSSINEFFKKLNEFENNQSSDALSQFGSVFSKAMGVDKITNQKRTLISNFPIPNTKEDILEFLALALPNAKKTGNFLTQNNGANKSHNDFVPTWKAKCEQIIMKARFLMKDDKKTLEEIEFYAKELKIK
jgi:hypothetical protein